MKSKLHFLTKTSLSRKIKTKWFLVANILFLVGIAGVMNIDSIINFFGGDFSEKTKIYVVDNTKYTYDILKENINSISKTISDKEVNSFELIKSDKTKEDLTEKLKKKEYVIVINPDKKNTIDVTLISEGYIDTIDYQILSNGINSTKTLLAIKESKIDTNKLNQIYSSIQIKREYLDDSKKTEDESMDMIMSTVFPFVILPFFMLSIFLIQTIGAEINDEKTTRGMEIIISSVSPKTHLFSKILAGNIFVIIQGILLFLYSGIGLLIRKLVASNGITSGFESQIKEMITNVSGTDFMSKLVYIIPITIILMLLTFIAYSLVAGILSSMTTNAEDFQQLQTPIIIVSLVGYYLSMMAGMFKGAIFIRVLSYIPFISAILSPSLLVLGQIGIIDVIISIIVMIITISILIKYGLKIYKVGILNYSSKDLWKKMIKAIKD